MQTYTASTQHIAEHTTKTFAQGFLHEFKLAVSTACFAVFCVLAIVGAWYVSQLFQNDSYKAVVFFLDLITISNVTSKYTIWIIKL